MRILNTHRYRNLLPILLLTFAPAFLPAQSPLLPTSVAYDSAGNLYFADTNRHQVFESSLAGKLTVIAGTGVQGFSGDAGLATSAQLNQPRAIAIGTDGTLYIADTGNQRIRSVSPSGTITSIAGTGAAGYSGDNAPATAAALNNPTALALDLAGALLVADSGNHRIRRIAAGQIATIAGTGTQGFSGDYAAATASQLDTPSGLAVAPDGRIFLSDTHNDRIRVISPSGIITTFAGTGLRGYSGDGSAAIFAELSLPHGLIYSGGTLLLADSNNHRIRSIDASGRITTIAGNGLQGISYDSTLGLLAPLNTPRAVALSLFSAPVFADTSNQAVRELLPDASLYVPAGLALSRTTAVSIGVFAATYGQSLATVTISGTAGVPQGILQLLDGSTVLAQSTLSSGSTTFPLPTLSAGLHTLAAIYAGDGINPAASSAITATVARATTFTSEAGPVQSAYAGLPLSLAATVASSAGTPTGKLNFLNGTTIVASGVLSKGQAAALYLTPPAGTLELTASYEGDSNFNPSVSLPVLAAVSALPDFTFTSTASTSQTVQGGLIAVFPFTVTSTSAPFTGAVSFSVTGLQPGATATFSPTQVVPGATSAAVMLSIQTVTLAHVAFPRGLVVLALLLPLCILRRKRVSSGWVLITLMSTVGCGDRTLTAPVQMAHTFPITVTATSTTLAGTIVSHSTLVTLSVQ